MKIIDTRGVTMKPPLDVANGDVIELEDSHFALVARSDYDWMLVSLNGYVQDVTEEIGTWKSKEALENELLEYWPDARKVKATLHIEGD